LNLAEEKEWQSSKHGKLTGLKFVSFFEKNKQRKPRRIILNKKY
jgi:hypothetical protein